MRTGFVRQQLHFAHRVAPSVGVRTTAYRCLRTIAIYAAIMSETRKPARQSAAARGRKDTVAVLLLFSRPANAEPIVRSLLCAPSIGRVVLSINNPDLELSDFPALSDPRVTIVRQATRTAPGVRLLLARDAPAAHFVLVDDDVLLFPRQFEQLIAASRAEPWRAHGFCGELYARNPNRPRDGGTVQLLNVESQVHVLNMAYFFSAEVLHRALDFARAVGIDDLREVANGEDVLLSMAGLDHARVHAIGRFGECVSSRLVGVATWATLADFQQQRYLLYDRLARVRRRLVTSLTSH